MLLLLSFMFLLMFHITMHKNEIRIQIQMKYLPEQYSLGDIPGCGERCLGMGAALAHYTVQNYIL